MACVCMYVCMYIYIHVCAGIMYMYIQFSQGFRVFTGFNSDISILELPRL